MAAKHGRGSAMIWGYFAVDRVCYHYQFTAIMVKTTKIKGVLFYADYG